MAIRKKYQNASLPHFAVPVAAGQFAADNGRQPTTLFVGYHNKGYIDQWKIADQIKNGSGQVLTIKVDATLGPTDYAFE